MAFNAALALALTILAGVGWLAYREMVAGSETDRWTTHSYLVIGELGNLLSSLKDAETGQRGFIITGDQKYLEPYEASLGDIENHLASLRLLTVDNSREQQRLASITPLVVAKLAKIKESIALRETRGFQAASEMVMTGAGRDIIDQIRLMIAAAQQEEAQLLRDRTSRKNADSRDTIRSVVLGGALGALALLLLFGSLNRELARRLRAQSELKERSAKLSETLGDLAHLSYAIMHDMRAPLRAMCGFSNILLKECPERLEARHQDLLLRIASAAERMDHLIVDALDYSRILREKLPIAPLDFGALLRALIETRSGLQPPQAQIRIEGPIPEVLANEAALRQCCSNLLDNAVKFVKPGTLPRVRIRAEIRVDMVRVWFEDNGIGISTGWQDRVFDLFQRVDREGGNTGIGLALVRKVIERMGGGVGVESQPGNGSRFWVELKEALSTQPSR